MVRKKIPEALFALFAALFLFVSVVGNLAAQDSNSQPNLQSIDFSNATISQAGPDSFYVRSVKINDSNYSLSVGRNSAGDWVVTKMIPESENLLPRNVMLDFASVTKVTANSLVVDGIILDGQIYQGTLNVSGPGSNILLANLTPGSLTDRAVQTADQFRQLLLSQETSRFQQELEAQRQEMQARNDKLQQQVTDLTQERAQLQAQLAQAGGSGETTDAQLTKRVNDLLAANKALIDNNQKLIAQNQDLLKKSQSLQADSQKLTSGSGNATGSDAALKDLLDRLQVEKTDLDRQNQQLAAQADSVKTLVDGLQTQNGVLAKRVADLQSELANLRSSFPTQYGVSQNQFSQTADRLQAQLAALQERVNAVSRQIANVSSGQTGAALTLAGDGSSGDAQLRAQISRLQTENRLLTGDRANLEQQMVTEILDKGYIGLFRPLLNRVLYRGFAGGDPQMGSWQRRAQTLLQNDPTQYFAKYALPVPQVARPTLYTMQLRATGSGWVGVGLHIFASDVQSRRGYGMGRSLLVWLTRDRHYYKNDGTYLQLYRSDDDVNMGRVLDAKIPESIGDYLKLEVLYEPDKEYITIAVNGQEKVRYKTWFGVDSGVTVALRTLGAGASFRDLEVRTLDQTR